MPPEAFEILRQALRDKDEELANRVLELYIKGGDINEENKSIS